MAPLPPGRPKVAGANLSQISEPNALRIPVESLQDFADIAHATI